MTIHVGGYILRTNVPILPPSGPRRAEYMRAAGMAALRQSQRLYSDVLNHLPLSTFRALSRAEGVVIRRALHEDGFGFYQTGHGEPIALGTGASAGETESLKTRLRTALGLASDALNNLEDDEQSDAAHDHLHRVGKAVGLLFGCPVEFENDSYWSTCKVSLAHSRWGFSIGMTARRLCSHCGMNIDECEHLLDQPYEYMVEFDEHGLCTHCVRTDCGHTAGEVILTRPWGRVAEADLHEVSVVRRPRDPLARATRVELDIGHLRAFLGPGVDEGQLNCTRCVEPCPGFTSPF